MSSGWQRLLIVLSIPPLLEDTLVDWLLEREQGFSSFPIGGHSSDPTHLSAGERVQGKQRRVRFEVAIDAAALARFKRELEAAFAGADVHYWAVPLADSGSLRTLAAAPQDATPAGGDRFREPPPSNGCEAQALGGTPNAET